MSARGEYWREAFQCALEAVDRFDVVDGLSSEALAEIGESLATSAEYQSEAFYTPENPMIDRNRKLETRLTWERELRHCEPCKGSGRIQYNAGPWSVDTGCDKCHGAGKVHPRGEREPVA